MILADQPTIFGPSVTAALSSKSDGNLKFGLADDEQVLLNRKNFLAKLGIPLHQTSLVGVTYQTDDFAKYRIVDATDQSAGMEKVPISGHADALIVTRPNHALFLPLADCAGVIIFDPRHEVLMVSHLGRHSVEQQGAIKSINYLTDYFDSIPKDLAIWISPSVGKATYPLRAFNGKSLQEVILEQLHEAGVDQTHIQASPIDTAHDNNYFSHSQFLAQKDTSQGRFAIVAMMTTQGEPAI